MTDIDKEYWRTVRYEDEVVALIRARYDENQEFAILRQRDSKPKEFAEYNTYCEECKSYIKSKMAEAQL